MTNVNVLLLTKQDLSLKAKRKNIAYIGINDFVMTGEILSSDLAVYRQGFEYKTIYINQDKVKE